MTVPLEVDSTSSGDARVVVQVSVGGGAAVPMLLDTGSSGLVVDASALGAEASATAETVQVPYVGTTIDGVVAQATVTMGGVSTSGPISVVSAQSASCGTDSGSPQSCSVTTAFGDGVQGIIGIGLSDGPSPASPTFSPLLQVPAPLDEGFTIELPPSGSGAGSLVVGPVDPPSGAVAIPLVASTSPTYPNGAPAFAKDVPLCWTVGAATGCGPTDLDLGNPSTALTPTDLPGLPVQGDVVMSGTAVAVAVTQGGSPLWSFTTGSTRSDDLVQTSTNLGSATAFNTGIAFFFADVVAYDPAHGLLHVWPNATTDTSGSRV